MRYSFNEIETTMRKAALGLGWPDGIAEQFGRAAAYLERRGIRSIEPILAVLEQGKSPARPVIVSETAVIPERSGFSAIAAFDLLAARVVRHVELTDPCNLDALIGLAGVAAKEFSCGFLLKPTRDSLVRVYENRVYRPDIQNIPSGSVSATLLPRRESLPEVAERHDVNSAAWHRSLELASLTLVPTTDASRRLGAGAGLRDND
ncbi:MAG: DUF3726 domain-containing protein [Albidovulum sp.]|nr:DUF3726 domain-containing protein [Albidovulum sp.]MDE0304547.1 DUF3726 domain-containing protein [Albidovulum sp.]